MEPELICDVPCRNDFLFFFFLKQGFAALFGKRQKVLASSDEGFNMCYKCCFFNHQSCSSLQGWNVLPGR